MALPGEKGAVRNSFLENLLNKYTGLGLTGAEREANAFTANQNRESMAFSSAEAQRQMAFQERMSNTQWQRGVADMRAAGLNPALAYQQGGASSMSGAAGQGASGASVTPGSPSSLSEILQAISMRKQMKLLDAQTDDVRAAAELKRTQAANTAKQTSWMDAINQANLNLTSASIQKYNAEIYNILQSAEGQRLQNQWNPVKWEQEYRKGEIDIVATSVGIEKAIQEIENLKTQNKLDMTEIEYKRTLSALTCAQIALVDQQTKTEAQRTILTGTQINLTSSQAWKQSWENQFTAATDFQPDASLWDSVLQWIGHVNRESAKNPGPRAHHGR